MPIKPRPLSCRPSASSFFRRVGSRVAVDSAGRGHPRRGLCRLSLLPASAKARRQGHLEPRHSRQDGSGRLGGRRDVAFPRRLDCGIGPWQYGEPRGSALDWRHGKRRLAHPAVRSQDGADHRRPSSQDQEQLDVRQFLGMVRDLQLVGLVGRSGYRRCRALLVDRLPALVGQRRQQRLAGRRRPGGAY